MEYPKEWDELPKGKRRKLIKKLKRERANRTAKAKSITKLMAGALALAILGGATYYWWINREILPPTDIAGHIESSPETHILDKPMPIQVQRHMLEHADGSGPPGVVINYNCQDFDCEDQVMENLEQIGREYPEFVYVAPYPKMTKKIAVTKLGNIQTFSYFDPEAIIAFIEGE